MRYSLIKYTLLILLMLMVPFCDGPILPEEPEFDNPYNPDDPGFVHPQVRFVEIPPSVLDTTAVRISWQGMIDTLEYEFAHRLNSSDWSDWSPDSFLVLEYLDDGPCVFYVKSRFPQGVIESDSIVISFTVEALPSKAVYLYPYKVEASAGDTLVFEVRAKELLGLYAIEFTLEFEQTILSPIDTIPGDFITGSSIVISERNPYWHFNIGAVHGSSGWTPGTGSILILRFKSLAFYEGDLLISNVDARDPNDMELDISLIRGSHFVIE